MWERDHLPETRCRKKHREQGLKDKGSKTTLLLLEKVATSTENEL
jgi:hypothetical protein